MRVLINFQYNPTQKLFFKDEILKDLEQEIKNSQNLAELEAIRLSLFGKNGEITELFNKLKSLPNNEKKNLPKKQTKKKSFIITL